jgi:hypothetical protein
MIAEVIALPPRPAYSPTGTSVALGPPASPTSILNILSMMSSLVAKNDLFVVSLTASAEKKSESSGNNKNDTSKEEPRQGATAILYRKIK